MDRVAVRLVASGDEGGGHGGKSARRPPGPVIFGGMLDTWRQKDPERLLRALAALAEDPEGVDMLMARTLALDMAEKDPDTVLRLAGETPDGPLPDHLVSSAVLALFGRDPARALETAAAWPRVRPRGALPREFRDVKLTAAQIPGILALVQSPARDDLLTKALLDSFPPAEAMAEAEKAGSAAQGRVMTNLARRFADDDPAGAMAAAGDSESFPIRTALRQAVGVELARKDPSAAARWAEEHLSAGQKNLVLKMAAEKLAETDPEAAKEIFERLPDGR